jgi:hypothetical protein
MRQSTSYRSCPRKAARGVAAARMERASRERVRVRRIGLDMDVSGGGRESLGRRDEALDRELALREEATELLVRERGATDYLKKPCP